MLKNATQMEKNKKIADLGNGLELWSLVISTLKEQDINAQVMDDRRMKILTSNIKNRGALESLPYVYKDGDTFSIISGHHRVRAANAAGLKTIYRYVVRRGGMLLLFDSRYSQYPEKLDTSEFDKDDFEKMEEGRYYEAELSVKIGMKV